MNTHESYVSLETAKMLKKVGFDWVCRAKYTIYSTPKSLVMLCNPFQNFNEKEHNFSAPTLDVAQRWLREVKGIEVYAHVFYDSSEMLDEWDVYVYEVNHITKHIEDYISSYDIYHTYEEAQEAGIQKCLTTLL